MRHCVFITSPSWAFVSSTGYLYSLSVQASQPKHKMALQIWNLLSVNDYQASPTTWPLKWALIEGVIITPAGVLPPLSSRNKHKINIHFHIFILLPDLSNPGPAGVKVKLWVTAELLSGEVDLTAVTLGLFFPENWLSVPFSLQPVRCVSSVTSVTTAGI